MPRLPFPNTARAVSVTIAFVEHEDNTLLRDDSATRAPTQRVERWMARWTTGGHRWTPFPLTTATWPMVQSATPKIWCHVELGRSGGSQILGLES